MLSLGARRRIYVQYSCENDNSKEWISQSYSTLFWVSSGTISVIDLLFTWIVNDMQVWITFRAFSLFHPFSLISVDVYKTGSHLNLSIANYNLNSMKNANIPIEFILKKVQTSNQLGIVLNYNCELAKNVLTLVSIWMQCFPSIIPRFLVFN